MNLCESLLACFHNYTTPLIAMACNISIIFVVGSSVMVALNGHSAVSTPRVSENNTARKKFTGDIRHTCGFSAFGDHLGNTPSTTPQNLENSNLSDLTSSLIRLGFRSIKTRQFLLEFQRLRTFVFLVFHDQSPNRC